MNEILISKTEKGHYYVYKSRKVICAYNSHQTYPYLAQSLQGLRKSVFLARNCQDQALPVVKLSLDCAAAFSSFVKTIKPIPVQSHRPLKTGEFSLGNA